MINKLYPIMIDMFHIHGDKFQWVHSQELDEIKPVTLRDQDGKSLLSAAVAIKTK